MKKVYLAQPVLNSSIPHLVLFLMFIYPLVTHQILVVKQQFRLKSPVEQHQDRFHTSNVRHSPMIFREAVHHLIVHHI